MDSYRSCHNNGKELVGKHITAFTFSQDKMRFTTDEGDFVASPYGGCCSSTWFESVDLPDALNDATVLAVENIDMPEQPYDEKAYDVVKFYGLRITTNKGIVVIDYRNSSNGYYGGWYELDFQPKR